VQFSSTLFGMIVLVALLSLSSSGGGVAGAQQQQALPPAEEKRPPLPIFDANFEIGIVPSEKSAHVEIRLGDGSETVEWLRFKFDEDRYRSIEADGELIETETGMEWHPPAGGGSLRYVFAIDHLRKEGSYDSRCNKNWAIFRGQDLVPKIRIRTVPISRSRSRMRLRLPEGWAAAVPYPRLRGGRYSLDESRTRFDRPNGWFAFGKLGVIRESFEETEISIAGPKLQGVRRMDVLALFRWTLPSLVEVFQKLPKRLNFVIAGDPMWRGGLSGPRSVYLHADRPIISQDATSPLLHELMHSLMRSRSGSDGNWVVEGIAEYYSIALLRRSDTISASRFDAMVEDFYTRAARRSATLIGSVDNSASRAKAVVAMIEIDAAIRSATDDASSLDEVVRILTTDAKAITTEGFREAVERVAGQDMSGLFARVGPSAS
jgi:hypothetical protein